MSIITGYPSLKMRLRETEVSGMNCRAYHDECQRKKGTKTYIKEVVKGEIYFEVIK